ncbi:MAG: ethanolamine permease [Myxococcota bacterium]|jgi:ethanolamine permease
MSDSVKYEEVAEDYFEKRKLRPYARVFHLWALGVGAVISGDFFGWNFGLAEGFGGMLVATSIITVMYLGLCFSIAEMSAALPHAGGAYSFARSSMGPWAGYVTGLAETHQSGAVAKSLCPRAPRAQERQHKLGRRSEPQDAA